MAVRTSVKSAPNLLSRYRSTLAAEAGRRSFSIARTPSSVRMAGTTRPSRRTPSVLLQQRHQELAVLLAHLAQVGPKRCAPANSSLPQSPRCRELIPHASFKDRDGMLRIQHKQWSHVEAHDAGIGISIDWCLVSAHRRGHLQCSAPAREVGTVTSSPACRESRGI